MGRHGSIFAFFALSTVAIIVMQPGPREASPFPVSTASEATRNNLTALQPTPEPAPLPVPDDVLSKIKRATEAAIVEPEPALVQETSAVPQAPALPAPPATPIVMDDTQPTNFLQPVPQPSFQAQPVTAPVAAPIASAPVRAELRDMSWSALGALQKLGHVPQAPGEEGSLINSIVRRSMSHVNDPVAPQAFATPAPQATQPVAPKPRQTAIVAPAPQPAQSHIGKRGTYTVTSGDNLALIAVKLYGSALKTDQLLMDNPALRANPNALRIGQVISYRTQ